MRAFRLRMPSPALAVSVVALIVALAGTSYAAFELAPNSVGTSQIKDGAVTNTKLASGAVTGAKVAAGSLTGTQIRAATLGTVPSAAHALNADKLAGLGPAAFERAGHLVPISTRMSNTDPDKLLLAAGPFRITGHCVAQNAQQNFIAVAATTTANDAAIHGHDVFGTEFGDSDFDVGDKQTFSQYQEGGTPPSPAGPFPATVVMSAPSGAQVSLTLTLGTRLFSDNSSQRVACVFGGYAVVS
jgi:hypothetical protein